MNERKQVVGVQYEPGQAAPTVILKGTGETAEHILAQAASQPDTRIVRDASLAGQLYRIPIDSPIGSELFPVMATLLIQVLELDQRIRESRS